MKRSFVSVVLGLVCLFSFFFCAEIIPIKILSYEHTIYIGRDEIVPVGKTVTAVVNDTLCFLVSTNQPEKVEEISIELTSKYADAPVLLSVTSKNSADSLWSIGCYPCNQSDTITAILSITYQSVTRRDTLTIMVTGGGVGSKPVIGNNNAILTFGEVATGQQLGLYVDATGEGVLQYQWKKDTTLLSGATDDTLVIRSLTPADTGWYQCLVSNDFGTQGSDRLYVGLTAINHPPRWVLDTFRFSIREDSLLVVELAPLCSDADRSVLHFLLDEGVPVGDTLVDGYYSWRPGFDDAGENAIVIIAGDGALTTPVLFAITVTNTNRAPRFEPDLPKGAYSVDEGQGLMIPFAATDPDGDSVFYFVNQASTTLPRAQSILLSDTALHWQSLINERGLYTVVLCVHDNRDTTESTISVGVGNVNIPPKISFAGNIKGGDTIRITEMMPFVCTLTVTDANSGDSLVLLSSLNSPSGSRYDTTTGIFSYTPDFSVSTAQTNSLFANLTFYARDNGMPPASDSVRIHLLVLDSNQAPVAADDTVTTKEDTAVVVDILANDYDPDGDSISIVSVTNGKLGTSSILGARIQYTPGKDEFGTDTIRYILRDGLDLCDTARVFVTIVPVNDPPVMRLSKDTVRLRDDTTAVIGDLFSLISAGASNENDNVTFQLDYSDPGSLLSSAPSMAAHGVLTIATSKNVSGKIVLRIKAFDGELYSEEDTLVVDVVDVNDAPVIDSMVAAAEVREGATLVLVSRFSDPDGTTPYISTDISGGFDSITVNGNIITLSPGFNVVQGAASRQFPVVFTVVDQEDASIRVEHIIVVTVIDSNRAPQVTFPANAHVGLGNRYESSMTISDPDGDVVGVSFNLAGFSYANGKVVWHSDRAKDWIGTVKQVSATVTDGKDTVEGSWELTLVEHEWEMINQIPGLVDICATDSNTVYVYTHIGNEHKVAKYRDGGKTVTGTEFSLTLYENMHQGYIPKSLNQVGDSLYMRMEYSAQGICSTYVYLLSASSLTNLGSFRRHCTDGLALVQVRSTDKILQTYKSGTNMVIEDPDLIYKPDLGTGAPCLDFKSAYKGVNVMLCNPARQIHQKTGSGNVWAKIKDPSTGYSLDIHKIEMASDFGDTIFFLNSADSAVYMCSDGRTSVSILPIPVTGQNPGMSLKINSVAAVSGAVAWVVNRHGEAHFTNNCFQRTSQSTLSSIKKVIIADDRKAVYAISTDNRVYRY